LAPPSDGAADEIPDEPAAPPARASAARRYADAETMARAPAATDATEAPIEEEGEGAVVMASDAGGDGNADHGQPRYAPPSARQRQPIMRPDEESAESHDGGLMSQLEAAKQALPY
jgi:hypothetical protein